MNTNSIIKNRNNGKSKYQYFRTRNTIILTDSEHKIKPHPQDLSLFNMAKSFNVKIKSKQRVRWFFNVKNSLDNDSLKQKIEKICSEYCFVGKRFIAISNDGKKNLLVIDTPSFFFTFDSIIQFSNDLFELAKENSIFYERWEVVPHQTTILSRMKKLFN
jgi:hypothetical protein